LLIKNSKQKKLERVLWERAAREKRSRGRRAKLHHEFTPNPI
jgi:hypothetical protein